MVASTTAYRLLTMPAEHITRAQALANLTPEERKMLARKIARSIRAGRAESPASK